MWYQSLEVSQKPVLDDSGNLDEEKRNDCVTPGHIDISRRCRTVRNQPEQITHEDEEKEREEERQESKSLFPDGRENNFVADEDDEGLDEISESLRNGPRRILLGGKTQEDEQNECGDPEKHDMLRQ